MQFTWDAVGRCNAAVEDLSRVAMRGAGLGGRTCVGGGGRHQETSSVEDMVWLRDGGTRAPLGVCCKAETIARKASDYYCECQWKVGGAHK